MPISWIGQLSPLCNEDAQPRCVQGQLDAPCRLIDAAPNVSTCNRSRSSPVADSASTVSAWSGVLPHWIWASPCWRKKSWLTTWPAGDCVASCQSGRPRQSPCTPSPRRDCYRRRYNASSSSCVSAWGRLCDKLGKLSLGCYRANARKCRTGRPGAIVCAAATIEFESMP